MTSAQFKPLKLRGALKASRSIEPIGGAVLSNLEEVWARHRKQHGPGWVPNNREQSQVYREHCRSLSTRRGRK